MTTLEEYRQVRLKKMQKLRDLGIDPFTPESKRTHTCGEILEEFEKLEGQEAFVTGRIRSIREHGKLMFMDLEDESGKIQLFLRQDNLSKKLFDQLKLFDLGDFLQANGEIVKTRTGQISIMVSGFKILTKALRPLPDEYYGLKDEEVRLRKRYLDFILNPEVREMFYKKSRFWGSMREFLQKEGFLEVETPVLEVTAGGADANPFITHHDSLDIDVYLRISMGELWQKRLMIGGFEKTFEIGRQFRNEGMSKEHLQDYTQMEFYMAYADYEDGMKLVEEMYKHVIKETFGTMQFEVFGHEIDFEKKWGRIDFVQAIEGKYGINVLESSEEDLRKVLDGDHIDYDETDKMGRLADTLWKQCRKEIAGPAFLIGHPVEVSPLAKRDPENSRTVQRFQVLLAGSEMGNGYSELNDPIDQAERFQEQAKMREGGDAAAQMHDADFVEALEYGMPPTCGFGVSERLFSFLMDKPIRECVMFPLMRPEASTTLEKEVVLELSDDLSGLPSREDAQLLLEKHVKDDYQLLHAKMVAKVLESYAKDLDEDNDLWYITGLLHDVDYFEFPDTHPAESLVWFKEYGYPEQLIHAVEAHAYVETGVKPGTRLAKYLLATDELAGLLYAYAKMRPEGYTGMKAKSIKKKFKDKNFAPGINRTEIQFGIDSAGIAFADHVMKMAEVFQSMDEEV